MRKLLLLIVLALGAGVAQADNGMLYVGAGVSNDNLKDITATNSNLNSTNWKVWAGMRPISVFAVEADYIDLGSQSVTSPNFLSGSSSTHLNYKAFTGYAVGYLPIPLPYLDVFGKAGLARWTASGGNTAISPGGNQFFSLSDNGTQFAWGAGGQLHIGNLGGRLEYESFSIRNTSGANLVSLSVFLNLF
jgi:hypothetical protein